MTHFCSMMLILRSILLLATAAAFASQAAIAQDELDGTGGQTTSFTTISIMRTWTPQERDFPNGGFNLMSSFATDDDRRWWFGLGFRAMGVWERDVLALTLGPTWWFAGDQKLGAFAFAQAGLGMGSTRGITGFDVFSDPTLTFGLASVIGVAGTWQVGRWVNLHGMIIGSHYSNEGGRTPYGVLVGLTFGGR
ncbi:MAG: hypothetical protein RLZZ150_1141 [Bacteroidota bacterium]|jgi:hypothetical protein